MTDTKTIRSQSKLDARRRRRSELALITDYLHELRAHAGWTSDFPVRSPLAAQGDLC